MFVSVCWFTLHSYVVVALLVVVVVVVVAIRSTRFRNMFMVYLISAIDAGRWEHVSHNNGNGNSSIEILRHLLGSFILSSLLLLSLLSLVYFMSATATS